MIRNFLIARRKAAVIKAAKEANAYNSMPAGGGWRVEVQEALNQIVLNKARHLGKLL